ncbi:unnamed protein product [Symbiodinium sp. CCMP2456]|nr:unnamed protein product [Symbiodinium sp. CCMP2456]
MSMPTWLKQPLPHRAPAPIWFASCFQAVMPLLPRSCPTPYGAYSPVREPSLWTDPGQSPARDLLSCPFGAPEDEVDSAMAAMQVESTCGLSIAMAGLNPIDTEVEDIPLDDSPPSSG